MASRDPDFVVVQRDFAYDRIPQLVQSVAGFGESPEWRELEQNDLDELPGVVLGALRRFLLRLSSEADVSPRGDLAESLSDGFDFIEKLAASDDSELKNAIVAEIFEPLEPGTEATRHFYRQLGTSAAELYRKYCLHP